MFGLGMMLQEHVDYSADGQPLYDSTWDYKIPTAACIPRQFNIALLKVSLPFFSWPRLPAVPLLVPEAACSAKEPGRMPPWQVPFWQECKAPYIRVSQGNA